MLPQAAGRKATSFGRVVIGIVSVISIITLFEVHRSHSDAHASRADGSEGQLQEPSALHHDPHRMAAQIGRHSALFRNQKSDIIAGGVSEDVKQQGQGSETQKSSLPVQLANIDLDDMEGLCHAEAHAEYLGEKVVQWGTDNRKAHPGECCNQCMLLPNCNVWVWCGAVTGCGIHAYQECWLKHASEASLLDSIGKTDQGVGWISGAMLAPEEYQQILIKSKAADRLNKLMSDPSITLVHLDISIKGSPAERVVIALFSKTAPLAAENFRQLCTGEKGVIPPGHTGAGGRYWLKGSAFYMIRAGFVCQSGVNSDSVYGGVFKDDPGGLAIAHDRAGLLSMASNGPNTNTAHFFISLGPAPHLDGRYVVFGEVVQGLEVIMKMDALAKTSPNGVAGLEAQVVISDAGQLNGRPVQARNTSV